MLISTLGIGNGMQNLSNQQQDAHIAKKITKLNSVHQHKSIQLG
jgi:hypothetical protein